MNDLPGFNSPVSPPSPNNSNSSRFIASELAGTNFFNSINFSSSKFSSTAFTICFIGSLYATTKLESKQVFLDELNTLFLNLNLNNNNNYYLIAEDFNARHRELGDRINKTRGRWLVNWDKENSITFRSIIYTAHEPTFTSKGSESYLDLCIADSRLNLMNLINNKLKTLNYDSDHRGILIDLNLQNLEINLQSIQLEIKANIDNHWEKICKKVNHRDHTKFFSIINKVFRPRERSHMPNLSIKEEDSHLIDKCDIKKDELNKTNNKYIIKEEADKINIIGAFYETINSPKYLNANTQTKEVADRIVQELEQRLARGTPLKDQLERLVNKINNYYALWNLRVSPAKCETIVFRRPARFVTKAKRINNDNFNIETFHPVSRELIKVPIKNILVKARNTYKSLGRLFHNRHISSRAKVICYQLLIRPPLTYASPVNWNLGAAQAEKLRAFERSCFRTALNMHRRPDSDYRERFSNKELYDAATIPRIDHHRIKLTRDYYNLNTNSEKGLLQPQAFTALDNLRYIQNSKNVPIIYHRSRHKSNKNIELSTFKLIPDKYSTALPKTDEADFHRLDHKKYWWIDIRSSEYAKLLLRKRNYNQH
ncbi:Protein of unknown function [Cotesia congregata]|uniref:Endonuclease/exonuclease/phosphatase domain-containing protein n=1 Tax=Cotesia congregata TaxID=51543 RepID=A0A8J2HGJ4_COTCN|nr:Protein of unknown function [Cotesia congregata]